MTTTHTRTQPTTQPTVRTYTERGTAVVCRTVLDTGTAMFFEITMIRSWRQRGATYQGTVVMRDGAWCAEAPTAGAPVTIGRYADYVDAENALVKRRTGICSTQPWTGIRPLKPWKPTCGVCGNDLTDGRCTRPDLHWTVNTEGELIR